MTRVFRKIRLRNLFKGKTSSYLAYAIGEIALIVIGILLALQVSNYNEKRKSNQREEKYLIALKDEMNRNLLVLKRERESLYGALQALQSLSEILKLEQDTVSEGYLSQLITTSFSAEFELDYETGITTQLISAGGLSEINSDTLKNIIASWDGRMVGLRKQEKELQHYRTLTTQYLIEKGDLNTIFNDPSLTLDLNNPGRKKNHSNKHFLDDQKFENYVQIYVTIADFLQTFFYEWLENEIEKTIVTINKSLNK